MWATPGLENAELIQDTLSCFIPHPSAGEEGQRPLLAGCKRPFHVYLDNLGVLGTSRENADRDLVRAVETLKNRGVDTHEEAGDSHRSTQHVGQCCSDPVVVAGARSQVGLEMPSPALENLGSALGA